MARSRVKLSGDLKKLRSLPKQITYAAKQTVISVVQEAQVAVQADIKATFTVRGTWFLPTQRYGIHVRWSRSREDLSARLETAADWLEEHETGEDKTPDRHTGHLTVPHDARLGGYGGKGIVPTYAKARRILPNVSELATRRLLLSAARPSKSQGKRSPRFKKTDFFLNREGTAIFERLPNRRLSLFYTLTDSSHIHQQSTVIEPTIKTVISRFPPIFNEKLANAVRTAK